MTPEPKGPTPEETPAPPASTRWSEDQEGEGTELMPPYIPGEQAAAAEHDRDEAGAGAELEAAPEPDTGPEPLTTPELEPERLASHDVEEGVPETAEPEPADEPRRAFPFDIPWEESAGTGSAEPPIEAAETPGAVEETTGDMEWEPAPPAGAEPEAFPFGAFDAEPPVSDEPLAAGGLPGALPGEAGEWEPPEVGGYGEPEERDTAAEDANPATELAARLDQLAARIRTEGRAAVERDLASGDRFTAVLAGVLAGYLAARDG